MTWARRRKLLISLILFLVALPGIGFFTYPLLTVAPSCTDTEHNGTETGIDCGGSCAYLCKETLAPLSTEFTRALTLLPGVYTVVAYVTNSNPNAYAAEVPYTLALYDERNEFISEQTGKTYILPGRTTPIVETNIRTGERIPTRAFLTIDAAPYMQDARWYRLTKLTVSNSELRDQDSLPRLEARIKNPTLTDVSNVETYAVVFDVNGNVRAASKSKIASIPGGESVSTVFTWPTPFTFTVGKIDIIPRTRPI